MKNMSIATGALITLLLTSLSVVAQTKSREDILKQIEAKRAELAALEKTFLSPSEEDQAAYADFLRQPKTGLIRLLPREKYDSYVRGNQKGLTLNGGGAYYSFTRLTHEYGNGSDIQLTKGVLSTGFAGANYGIMTSLGDTPLQNVSLATVQVLAEHTPPTEEPGARIEQRKWAMGTTIDGNRYAREVSLEENKTYAVRSIEYHGSDVLVAFRVVRVDNDDSATILWKLLKKYPTPRLASN